MKTIKRLLAFLLIAAMLASFSSVFALDKYQYTKYRQYLCIGDSVAAGYTYSGSWDNYGFTRVRGAYHDIVANAVDADLLQYATSGFRLIELRYMMDGKATDPDDFWKQCFGSSYMSPEVLDGYTEMFQNGIRTSDLMSINLGSNDILTASAMKFIFAMNGSGSDENKSAMIKAVEAYLDKLATQNPSFADLVKLAKTAGSMPTVLRDLIKNIYTLFTLYKENWEATMDKIYNDLNPDITMLVLSVYNPAYKIYLDDSHVLNLGPIVQPVIDMINHYMQYESKYAGKYTFVNVDGVDSWGMSLNDPDYFTYFVWSMHPTRLGHTDIATRMLKVLPEHWVDIEFTKQPENVTAAEGEQAQFTVETKYGNTPYYQWQTAPKGSDSWTDIPSQDQDGDGNPIPGANPTAATATLTVTADKALDGQQYRCVVKDFYGQRAPITSNAATLTVTDKTTPDPKPDPDPDPVKELPFVDVDKDVWSYDDIAYVYENGLMTGTDATHFDPAGNTTRAQFATVIYRMAGSPAVTQSMRDACPFTDLSSEWYRDAVIWAYDAGVVNGTSKTTFSPANEITREQLVAMLYRYTKDADGQGDLSKIIDADKISDYAKPAVAWAVENGIVNGMPDGSFAPKGNATREQMAAIIARYDKLAKA